MIALNEIRLFNRIIMLPFVFSMRRLFTWSLVSVEPVYLPFSCSFLIYINKVRNASLLNIWYHFDSFITCFSLNANIPAITNKTNPGMPKKVAVANTNVP